MIAKISKLKSFGIFHDFSWGADLDSFKRFNLIYGWNRSGKTTISRVFSSCEKKMTYDKDKFRQYPAGGEFEIKMEDGSVIKNKDIASCSLPIKVFNQDFVNDNISFDISSSCSPIVYVSEEDIESKKRLGILRAEKEELVKNYENAKKNKNGKEDIKTVFLKGLGVNLANIIFDKTYNRTKAEDRIKNIGIDNFSGKILKEEDKKSNEEISKGEVRGKQDKLASYSISLSFGGENVASFEKLFLVIKGLLNKKVISETIERLKEDASLNEWVKKGFDLHKTKSEKEKCLFCQKPLDKDYLDVLSKHFSKDYEYLLNELNILIGHVKKLKQEKMILREDVLYPDLRDSYKREAESLNEEIDKANAWMDEAVQKMEEKNKNVLSVIEFSNEPSDFVLSINGIIGKINSILEEHDKKVDNHSQEVDVAREKLELHAIATALVEQDYKKIVQELSEAVIEEEKAGEVMANNASEIVKLEQKNSDVGKAIGDINKHLEEFFGRKEIQLELDESKKGYTIKRDGKIANNLSEGEKTAIAFSYFIVKVQENDFKTNNGIIFIDDPISSFDSNFIYHCFSLIKNNFKDVGQIFISTHNFQLFNLIKYWFINKNRKVERENRGKEVSERKPIPCGFYMIENHIDADIRKAVIKLLEKTLQDFKSEYHFLFYKLSKFSEGQDHEYEDFYTIGNIARRFLEIFTNFKIPTTGDLESRIQSLEIDTNKISLTEQGRVYNIIQEFSHGLDPTSTIEHKDKGESQEAIKILLRMVEEADPKHYSLLRKTCNDD